jgi:hypothetical protein
VADLTVAYPDADDEVVAVRSRGDALLTEENRR